MSHLWSLQAGAQPLPDNGTRFTVWAPRIRTPRVRVLTGAGAGDYHLAPGDRHGFFSSVVPGVAAGDDYVFLLDDERAVPDPVGRWLPDGVHGPSRVVDPGFAWTDAWSSGVHMEDLVMYELHVGTFTPEGTFEAIIPRLASLKALGVSAIALMPVAQFPGQRNWGYDGVGLYAVQDSYGGPIGLKALVDAAHAAGLGVIIDVVYNHVGPEGNYLDRFGPYFTEKYRTPWGPALNYDGAHSDQVRRFVIDNALFWIVEYHADGLRLDAVHEIFDFGATHLLEDLAYAVHDQAARLGKSIVVIAESGLNDPKLLRPTGQHGYALDGQWSDDFHHAIHAALTGDREGYYADYGGVPAIADAMREPFVYAGRYSAHRARTYGRSSMGIPRSRFVVSIQNHDQVGNRAGSKRLAALLQADQQRLAAALLLLSPYVPLLFMGEEYGETAPFHYFIDHGDRELAAAVRDGRKREFESFGWSDDVPDPSDPDTFNRSSIDWTAGESEARAPLRDLYRDLLALRRDERLLRPDGARLTVENGEPGWITLLRTPYDNPVALAGSYAGVEQTRLLALFNCSATAVDVPLPDEETYGWTLRLTTDATSYGGQDRVARTAAAGGGGDAPKRLMAAPVARSIKLPPWTAALYEDSMASGDSITF